MKLTLNILGVILILLGTWQFHDGAKAMGNLRGSCGCHRRADVDCSLEDGWAAKGMTRS
jgi:hypothetical protein